MFHKTQNNSHNRNTNLVSVVMDYKNMQRIITIYCTHQLLINGN